MTSSKLLRGLLDNAYDLRAGKTLRERLRANEDDTIAAIRGGSAQSLSANGRTTVFSSLGQGLTQAEVQECWRRLIDLHDQSATDLSLTYADNTNDPAIKTQMMTYLREQMGFTSNWMYLAK